MNLQQRFEDVLGRLGAACSEHGRPSSDVNLLAVSKTVEAARVAELHALGQLHFGENYVQEAQAKIAELSALEGGRADEREGSGYSAATEPRPPGPAGAGPQTAVEKYLEDAGGPLVPDPAEKARHRVAAQGVSWHLIGPLQSNKAKPAAAQFSFIHSLDRLELADRLDAVAAGPLRAFVQVRLGDESSKSGIDPDDLLSELERWSARSWRHLRLVGFMTIPPPASSRPHFARLRALRDRVRQEGWPMFLDYDLSMGMSDDFADAVAEGSNWVRVGRALFGERAPRV